MAVQISNMLAQQLAALGQNPQTLINLFSAWIKSQKLDCTVFGKDGLNRNSKYLAHVHMRPVVPTAGAAPQSVIDEAEEALVRWKNSVRRRSYPKSDKYLFYVHNGNGEYLLIYIVNNPGAHQFLQNPSPSEATLLKAFEAAADQFWHFKTFTI